MQRKAAEVEAAAEWRALKPSDLWLRRVQLFEKQQQGIGNVKHGKLFFEILSAALREDERCLRQHPHASLRSIRQYDESWVKYILFKAAAEAAPYPHLSFEVPVESAPVDICFVDKSDRSLALFEVKGPFEVRPSGFLPKSYEKGILTDIRKQVLRTRKAAARECYVALLPHGSLRDIKAWLRQTVRRSREQFPEIRFATIRSQPISLNWAGRPVLLIVVLAVKA